MSGSASVYALAADESNQTSSDRIAWVAESLKRMLSISPGMNREQLAVVFTTEGGKFTALQRTFVSRDCPFFKVDVKFQRAEGPSTNENRDTIVQELETDVIASISRPYLQFSVWD